MSYREFLSAIFGTNQQQATGQQGYQLPQQADMAQRQIAGMRQAQAMSAMGQAINPALLQNATPRDPNLQQQPDYAQRQAVGAQNAFSYWAAKGMANAAWMPEPTQWDQDYEEAMREVDEIAPGWKE